MKKLLALILSVALAIPLTSCGSKETKLTLDNYEQYLNITAFASTSGDSITMIYPRPRQSPGEPIHLTCHNSIAATANVFGASTNFNYNDVVAKVKVTVTYSTPRDGYGDTTWDYDSEKLELILEVKTDISGKGSTTLKEQLATHKACSVKKRKIEVLEITGTVTPA